MTVGTVLTVTFFMIINVEIWYSLSFIPKCDRKNRPYCHILGGYNDVLYPITEEIFLEDIQNYAAQNKIKQILSCAQNN